MADDKRGWTNRSLTKAVRCSASFCNKCSRKETETMFEWIRARVRNAVLQGVNDAMAELQGPRAEQPQTPVALQLEYQGEEPSEPTRAQKRGKA